MSRTIDDDNILSFENAENAERSLQRDPNKVNLRAQLIRYYYELEVRERSLNDQRLRHMSWFIENKPDLEFCGTAPFYISKQDPRWDKTIRLWKMALESSPEEMRRINACMFVLNADRDQGKEWLDSLFQPNSGNLWVLALRDLLHGSTSCFQSIVESERCKPSAIDDEHRAKFTQQYAKYKNWEYRALKNVDDIYDGPKSISYSISDLDAAAEIAGRSVFRFESNSVLGFDPEVISLRFTLASWIITHIPFSTLATSHIFMSPFESPIRYHFFGLDNNKSFECLFQYLAELWTIQLRLYPKARNILKNAASFAHECSPLFRSSSKLVISTLTKTTTGTTALRKEQSKRKVKG